MEHTVRLPDGIDTLNFNDKKQVQQLADSRW